jgi:hypothetical protein
LQTFGASAVTIPGENTVEERMAAVDRFQTDDDVGVAIYNLVAGGVGLNLTAATHVIFHDLDWVPENHLQAEDRASAWASVNGSRSSTCLPMHVGRLIADLLPSRDEVEADQRHQNRRAAGRLDARGSLSRLRALGPALLQENRVASGSAAVLERLEKLAAATPRAPETI